MNLTSATIEGFVKTILYKRFDGATDVPDCHREWWDMCCADNRYVAIAAPRAHAKSTSITHSYTLASLLFQESKFAIIVSDTEAQAILFLGDIKNELLENQDLIEMFGVRRFVKLSETDIIVEMEGGHKFRVMAKGAEQLRRGLKWDGKRPDLIVCHEKGTQIYTPESGWVSNEEYPGSREIVSHGGYLVTFEDGTIETVSTDHRYLTEEGWKFIWQMMPNENVLENINVSGKKQTLISTKLLKNVIESLRQVKRSIRSGLMRMLIDIVAARLNTTSRIKRLSAKMQENLLLLTLNGKLLNVQNEGQGSYTLHRVG